MAPFSHPLQFVYQQKRGDEDAIRVALKSIDNHLEGSKNREQCSNNAFFYFSLSFSIVQPDLLAQMLLAL